MIFLFLSSAILTVAAVAISYRYERKPPLHVSIPFYLSTAVIMGGLGIRLTVGNAAAAGGAAGIGSAAVWVSVAVLAGLPPIIAGGLSTVTGFGELWGSLLFDPREADPDHFTFARAKTRAVRGDVAGAIYEYRQYFLLNPKRPAPLFAAAAYAERHQQWDTAIALYRDIMRGFEKKLPIWAEAAWRLHSLLQSQFPQDPRAERVLRELAQRTPDLEQGRQARLILAERADLSAPPKH